MKNFVFKKECKNYEFSNSVLQQWSLVLSGLRKMGLEDTGKNVLDPTSFMHSLSIKGTIIKMTNIIE